MRAEEHVAIKGFLFYEATLPPRQDGHYATAIDYSAIELSVVSRSSGQRLAVNLSCVNTEPEFQHFPRIRPADFVLLLPDTHDWRGLELRMQGFTRVAPLDDVVQAAREIQGGQRQYINVLNPKYGSMPTAAYVELLKSNLAYHHALGVTRTLLYVRRHQQRELNAHPAFDLLTTNGMSVVVWDALALPDDAELPPFDYTLVRHHSVLSLWGEGAVVMANDVDEFVALPRGRRLDAEFEEGCLHEALRAGCWELLRINKYPGRSLAARPAQMFDSRAWAAAASAASMTGHGSPLWLLTREVPPAELESFWRYKPMVDPDRSAFGFTNHDGLRCISDMSDAQHFNATGPSSTLPARLRASCDQTAACRRMPRECVYIAHNQNAVAVRNDADAATTISNTDWLWPLSHVA
jgi:hypothetical protein